MSIHGRSSFARTEGPKEIWERDRLWAPHRSLVDFRSIVCSAPRSHRRRDTCSYFGVSTPLVNAPYLEHVICTSRLHIGPHEMISHPSV
jgi:hypothetical protein